MKTVKEVSLMTGVSVRTLHYYDSVDILKPTALSDAGYRLYDDDSIKQLYLIIIYRELGFSVKEIKRIISASDFDRNAALDEQIKLLKEKEEKIKNRITLAQGLKMTGVKHMSFKGFEKDKIDEYFRQAKTLWGNTPEYKEFEQKSASRNENDEKNLEKQIMQLFEKLGTMRTMEPDSTEVQNWVIDLRKFMTENFYNCSPKILYGLGQMYAGGGSMTENIDAVGGAGTGEFAFRAIEIYCCISSSQSTC